MMKKQTLFVFILVCTLCLSGCNVKSENAENTTSGDSIANERYPSFVVENVNASKGDKDVVVRVSLKDNPGFLTMAMNIEYDSDCMSLTKALCGSDYSAYNFIGPKNKQSGCTACWFAPELPSEITDGNILELHFEVSNHAQSGSYPISVLRPDNGGVVDKNKQAIIFNNATGYIKID